MNRGLYNRVGDLIEVVEDDHSGSLDMLLDSLVALTKSSEVDEIDKHAKQILSDLEDYVDRRLKAAKDSIFSGAHRSFTEQRIRAKGGE